MANQANTEYETKITNIDVEQIIQKLRNIGAKETSEFLSRRYVYDLETEDIEWIRLRTNGNRTTLTYKHKIRGNVEVGKTTEIEVEVSDFDKTAEILKKLPFKEIYYQENKNHIFKLNDIEFSIDSWPLIKPFLEIESYSKEKVAEGVALLGVEDHNVGDIDIKDLFTQQGIDVHSYKELKFEE
jgi:adenylate cyclase class 2